MNRMNAKSVTKTLAAVALGGMLTGAMAITVGGCSHDQAGSQVQPSATGQHDCKGKNACKGQGGCKTGDNGCKAKNSCKGQGGCKSV